MNHLIIRICIPILAIILFSACKKGPGDGGNSSIKGHVWEKVINGTYQVQYQQDAQEEDVFLIYGDDVSYSDRAQSSHDGMFEFKYLRPGKYKIFVYSDDSVLTTNNPDNIAILKEIEIKDKKDVVDAGEFTIFKDQ